MFISTALISAGLQVGCACLRIAAAPAMCGADMEVPVWRIDSVPNPARTEGMELPGAAMSGLRRLP